MKKQLFLKQKNPFSRCSGFSWICLPVFLTLFVFSSCNKEDSYINNNDNVINDGITIINGRMVFKDSLTFMNHVKWIHENQGNSQIIIDKNNSMGFKSMSEYYLEGIKLEEDDPRFKEYLDKYPYVFYKVPFEESILYELPHSIVVCYCANKDGLFQIGNSIYRLAWKYVYEITDGDETKIQLLYLTKEQIKDKSITINPSVPEIKSYYGSTSRLFSNHSFRIVGRLNEYTIAGGWWYDAITTPQHKVVFWFRASLATKTSNNDGYWSWPYPYDEQHEIQVDSTVATGQTTLNLVACGGSPIDGSLSYCPALHRGRLDGQYIYIYWADALSSSPVYSYPDYTPGTEPF